MPGQHVQISCELKIIADVGLVELPNAGKSTLLNAISNTNIKSADYPFTTLAPQLGVVLLPGGESFIVSDLPGLNEGAHTGRGLGFAFLKHIERCKILAHVVSLGNDFANKTPWEAYQAIRQELAAHSPQLAAKPELIIASKIDLPNARQRLAEFTAALPQQTQVLVVSSLTKQYLKELKYAIYQLLQQHVDIPADDDAHVQTTRLYKFEAPTQ